MQSKKQSLIESVINVVIGYVVALLSQLTIFPLFGVHLPLTDNLLIGAFFTIVSITRSYVIRRLFNRKYSRNPIADMPN
ncbi:DUF7220 family protein [Vibrio coralliilyticus]|uniref:DUF7220 family protein n=1 Tax=Vibrio coralliilyticus TaxID=190893 RepID=UPI001E32F349|nr:hypothetical protein [Vibrio coralliilyticus]MCC2521045.1 hypothetical protein [Vibrio coralliilyticus]